jgi:hypothetical protein
MDLGECRFYYAGEDMNFVIFSDDACRARFLESIRLLPMAESRAYAYAIEPGPNSHWVVVRQTNGEKMNWRLFLRVGEKFLEKRTGEFPKELQDKLRERFGKLTASLLGGEGTQPSEVSL